MDIHVCSVKSLSAITTWVTGNISRHNQGVDSHCLGSCHVCLFIVCSSQQSYQALDHPTSARHPWLSTLDHCHQEQLLLHSLNTWAPCGGASNALQAFQLRFSTLAGTSTQVLNVSSVTEPRVVDVNFCEFWKRLVMEQDMVDWILGWSWSGYLLSVALQRWSFTPWNTFHCNSVMQWCIEVLGSAMCLMGLCWRSVPLPRVTHISLSSSWTQRQSPRV